MGCSGSAIGHGVLTVIRLPGFGAPSAAGAILLSGRQPTTGVANPAGDGALGRSYYGHSNAEGRQGYEFVPADASASANGGTHPDTKTGANSNAPPRANGGAHPDTSTVGNSNAPSSADSGAHPDASTGGNSNAPSSADGGAHANTSTGGNSNTAPFADAHSDAHRGAHSNASALADGGTHPDANTGANSNTLSNAYAYADAIAHSDPSGSCYNGRRQDRMYILRRRGTVYRVR